MGIGASNLQTRTPRWLRGRLPAGFNHEQDLYHLKFLCLEIENRRMGEDFEALRSAVAFEMSFDSPTLGDAGQSNSRYGARGVLFGVQAARLLARPRAHCLPGAHPWRRTAGRTMRVLPTPLELLHLGFQSCRNGEPQRRETNPHSTLFAPVTFDRQQVASVIVLHLMTL
jgi:hypothetical protein